MFFNYTHIKTHNIYAVSLSKRKICLPANFSGEYMGKNTINGEKVG